MMAILDPGASYVILPNTAGCSTAEEASARQRVSPARARPRAIWVKLEVIADLTRPSSRTYEETTRRRHPRPGQGRLHRPPLLQRRSDRLSPAAWWTLGCRGGDAARRRRSAPGSASANPTNLAACIRELITKIPVIVDAGVGTASDASLAMELGMDGVLMNTAIAGARDPDPDGRGDAQKRSPPDGRRSSPAASPASSMPPPAPPSKASRTRVPHPSGLIGRVGYRANGSTAFL